MHADVKHVSLHAGSYGRIRTAVGKGATSGLWGGGTDRWIGSTGGERAHQWFGSLEGQIVGSQAGARG
jgi:hypothetical protein